MAPDEQFDGFPGVSRGTVIPNLFFASVLPQMVNPGELLAFLWVSRLTQEQRGQACYVSTDEVWAESSARAAFEALSDGREGLRRGLSGCVDLGALLGLQLASDGDSENVYFINNPASQRAVMQARRGDLTLRPRTVARDLPAARRPDIFRVYEEHIGTITPFVAERLQAAQARYPWQWIEDAFREAADMNIRNWRYVERILQNMERDGRSDEKTGGSTLAEREQRYLGSSGGPPRSR